MNGSAAGPCVAAAMREGYAQDGPGAGGVDPENPPTLIRQELEATTQMLRRSAQSKSRQEALLAVLAVCQESIGGDVSTIMVYDEAQDALIGVARSDEPYNPEEFYRLPLREPSLTGLAFREQRVIAIEDVIHDPRVSQRVRGYFGARSGIAAPLIVDGEAIGAILSMNRERQRGYSSEDIELLGDLAFEAARILYADLHFERRVVAEHRFERLLRHAPIAILLLDADDRLVDFNEAASSLTGRPPEALRGSPIDAFVAPKSAKDFLQWLASVDENSSASLDTTFLRGDGTTIPVAVDASRFTHARSSLTQVFVRNMSRERKLIDEMTRLATYDQLTGLLNRRSFEASVEAAINECKTAGTTHTVLYVDLDQFKIVNDSCGHLAGDELLKQLAQVIRAQIRESDVGARLGGDEFGVLFRDCTESTAMQIAERLRAAIARLRFTWNGKSFAVTASIGAAPIERNCAASACSDLPALMTAVDSACYVAKDHGRNRVQIYRPDDAALEKHRSELRWTPRLREGLDHNRFFLVAQPIYEVERSAMTMCELLLRLRDSDGTICQPAGFIPAAERYGLMPEIDRWVLAHALEWIASIEEAWRYERYSINVSGECLNEREFVPFVRKTLEESGVDPTLICFEITETAAMRNLTEATRLVNEVRDLGCKFALDDFGKGFSSYGYLKHLPVDYLKLDGEFVKGIENDPIDHAMVEAIHNLGHMMGLRTIAEHIENQSVFNLLAAIGIDFVQGHFVATAQTLETIRQSSEIKLGAEAGLPRPVVEAETASG